jgi:lipopolysaccharide/colanic/teichoic acid biosynthesis glycosyltransferase
MLQNMEAWDPHIEAALEQPVDMDADAITRRLIIHGLRKGASERDTALLSRYASQEIASVLKKKRVFDLVCSSIILFFLAPLMVLVAFGLTLTSPGPVFFRQKRYGHMGTTFEVLKFRTMYEKLSDKKCVQQTTRNDQRVTPFGRLLRRSSLDELPQLFNVLRGEMSLVGPRPHAVEMKVDGQLYDRVFDDYHLRHLVPPGITGWSQINGSRGPVWTMAEGEQRLDLDLAYINSASLGFDLSILWRTFSRTALCQNAY